MFAELMPRVDYLIATQSIHPRAMGADQLVALAQKYSRPAEAVLPLENALSVALNKAGENAVVLGTGSLFIAAAIRETWQKLIQQRVQL